MKRLHFLLPTLLLAFTAQIVADLTDGKPCFSYINPPGEGVRYVCTSTSSHTAEHSELIMASRGWRTRITARRESEPAIYDRTFDSLSEPLGDPFIQGALADARRLVEGTGFTPAAPSLLSSSTALVRDQPLAPNANTIAVGTHHLPASTGSQTVCVGALGDLTQPPPPLPAGPCILGATPVTLRPLDESVSSPLTDRIDDTHTHTRTDRYSNVLVTGEITTVHYEIVAKPGLPCDPGLRCISESHHTVHIDSVRSVTTAAWSTRVSGRLSNGSPVFEATINSIGAADDDAVRKAFLDARGAVAQVVGPGAAVTGPVLVSSARALVSDVYLPAAERLTSSVSMLQTSGHDSGAVCVGDIGDRVQAPVKFLNFPCPAGAWILSLALPNFGRPPSILSAVSTHTHTQRDAYQGITVTGDLTATHYEYVAEPSTSTATLTVPIVLSPSGGSAFTSELTLANLGPSDVQATFAYTPAFGSTPSSARVQSTDLPCVKSDHTSPILVGGAHYDCTSSTHHTFVHGEASWLFSDAWSTRVTSHLPGGPPLFDVTINATVSPELDDAVRQAFADAKSAVIRAAPDSVVTGPLLLTTARQTVADAFLPNTARVASSSTTFNATLGTPCVGDLGDSIFSPVALPAAPCAPGAFALSLSGGSCGFGHCYDVVDLLDHHTHTQRDEYPGLSITGALTTSHYDFSAASTSTQTVTDTLPGATQRVIPDAVAYLRSLGLTDPGAGGVLRMTFAGSASPDVYASARTTAAVPEGRVGLAYPALPPSRLLSSSVVLAGLRQNSLDRSNVAVLNAGVPADGDVTLRLTVSSGDPANPQTKALPDIPLSPGAFSQISGVLVSNGLSLSNGTVKVDRVAGTAPFSAYAVVNDQATNDGSFIEPTPANPASPIPTTTLPVLVETSSYSTELVLTNLSAASRTLNFTWVAPALTGGRATFSIALLPNEQQILPAFVQLLRDRGVLTDARGPSFAGALFVSDSTGDLRGVSVSARILSALGNGRAGVALPSIPSGSESTAPVWLCGLQQNAETRSNLALVNVGSVDSSSSDFRIDLYDGANGAKVASPVATVPAKGFTQIDRILAAYAPGVTQGCALVTRTSGNNPFLAYAVLNDGSAPGQRSGDGAYVASRPVQ